MNEERCKKCPLVGQPYVEGRGKPREDGTVDILLIGESPGRVEAAWGKVFLGPSGDLLSNVLADLPARPYWMTNAARCFTQDAKEKEAAAKICKENLMEEIVARQPKVIVTLGNIPTRILLGRGPGITRRRGLLQKIEIAGRKIVVIPTVHPAFILRGAVGYHEDFKKDLAKAIVMSGERYPVAIHSDAPDLGELTYEITTDIGRVFKEAESERFAVLDLETTGLKFASDTILCAVVGLKDKVEL